MAFLLNSQAQGVSGKYEQSTQTPWRGASEVRGPMQLHRLHWLKAGPDYCDEIWRNYRKQQPWNVYEMPTKATKTFQPN